MGNNINRSKFYRQMAEFGLESKARMFSEYVGQYVRAETHNRASYIGRLDDVQKNSIILKPYLMSENRHGDVVEVQKPLALRVEDVLTTIPLPDGDYEILQQPHPWHKYKGREVAVMLRHSQGTFYGILEEVLRDNITLKAAILGGSNRKNYVLEEPIDFWRSDIASVFPIPKVEYEFHLNASVDKTPETSEKKE
jgi:ribosome maturation factor RimP